MKKCIWCKQTEEETTFETVAHTVPQSLGGNNICENVCDPCNHYFGTYQNQQPPIDNVIKETFNVSRARFLSSTKEIGKNKALPRFKSTYFNVNFERGEISPKGAYKLKKDFQRTLARQLKKGLYKMFLEEQERQNNSGHDSKFEFIREFARFDQGDYPLLYFERKYGMIVMIPEWAKSPPFIINSEYKMKYLMSNDHFFEFEFLGHVFAIPISTEWKDHFEAYIEETRPLKQEIFKTAVFVQHFNDVDFTLRILND